MSTDNKNQKEQESEKNADEKQESAAHKLQQKRVESDAQKSLRGKLKNVTALAVLLGGVAVGSFFFDITQVMRGEGFSQKALRDASVIEHADKTWVAYDDPKVMAQVFSADDCADCFTDEVLVWLRRIVPTVTAQKRDVRDDATLAQAREQGIAHIPAFLFDKSIENTDFFQQAALLFEPQGDGYRLRTAQLGVPVGEYIAQPEISAQTSVVLGNEEAPITIIEYSDFTCEFCKTVHPIVERVLAEYGDTVRYAYKHLPLPGQPQSINASLAAECAHEQEKFAQYANILFARQTQWAQATDDARFLAYARELRLNGEQFSACLTERTYEEKVRGNVNEALSFGIAATPTLFVNDAVITGVTTYDGLKKTIDDQIAAMQPAEEVADEEDVATEDGAAEGGDATTVDAAVITQ